MTFYISYNQRISMYSVDLNVIFDKLYSTESDSLLNI